MDRDYTGLNDEELISLYRDGNTEIVDYIMEKYKNLVRSKARSMFILGGDTQDLIQEGMIGLFKAIRDYDFGRDALFCTFAELCVTRNMYTAIQKSTRKKNSPLNTYIPINPTGDVDQEDYSQNKILKELIAKENMGNPDDILIDKENSERLEKSIRKDLSPLEFNVLQLLLTGMNYIEIARVLGRDEKSIDNALQRMKSKVRKSMSEIVNE